MEKFTLTIFMAIADRERELIGIRTRAALKAKKEAGELGRHENQQAHYITSEQRQRGNDTRTASYCIYRAVLPRA